MVNVEFHGISVLARKLSVERPKFWPTPINKRTSPINRTQNTGESTYKNTAHSKKFKAGEHEDEEDMDEVVEDEEKVVIVRNGCDKGFDHPLISRSP